MSKRTNKGTYTIDDLCDVYSVSTELQMSHFSSQSMKMCIVNILSSSSSRRKLKNQTYHALKK